MNAFSTELLARDRQASFDAEAARDRRRGELAPRHAGHGAVSRLAARAVILAHGLRTHHHRVASPAPEVRGL